MKTYSQQIARAFEIADYFLLIPALFGLFMATIMFNWFSLVIWLVFGFGATLLVGYIRHSRGWMSEKNIPALWIASAAYNASLLLPVLGYVGYFWQTLDFNSVGDRELWKPLVFNLVIVSGYLTAIGLSVKAFLSERNQKYR